ncbi:cation diffusion facilitator family transporter [Reinekea thalattae]|uniref:Cation transporter n=1 Tax=Reinekea thalattae TaxID=2593301 RepID=A0A5C8Z539_9GAMM|nr:cation diffusion facilitator family transporter [Reinekea thalattae]TXR53225.1 cation transporter [Reinekea thalattae]
MNELNSQQRYKIINRVNWVCTLVDALLSALKLSVGVMARSPGLIADGLHSLSDLATDIFALILSKFSQKGPDDDHAYGHARYETIGTAIIGTALIVAALSIGFENIAALAHGDTLEPSLLALITVGVSVIIKEVLFHYTIRWAKASRSSLLEANAWHSRTDSLSSVAVFIGIACSLFGFALVEYISAILVAIVIGHMGIKLAWNALLDLTDRGVPTDKIASYAATLESIPDILDAHQLRSRLMGSDVIIDAHIQVLPKISISEAHQINDFAVQAIRENHPEVTDVTLHIDFENDSLPSKTRLEPKRQEVEALLKACDIDRYQQLGLHYAKNKIEIELQYDSDVVLTSIKSRCEALESRIEWIRSIRIYQAMSD